MTKPVVSAVPDAPVDEITAVVAAATSADAVAPLDESAIWRISQADGVRHWVARDANRVVGYAQRTVDDEVALVVHPEWRRRGAGAALLAAATDRIARPTRGWAHGDVPAAQGFARAMGYVEARRLWRMTAPLELRPIAPPLVGAEISPFVPGQDDAGLLAANAAAFAEHPEQGAWGPGDLATRVAEPWFDPGDVLLLRDTVTGEVMGLHWVKIVAPKSGWGEVYVMGVVPAAQGRRWGRALFEAGLARLHERGVTHVELYVESDQHVAVTLYRSAGFSVVEEHVMYRK